MSPHAAIGHGVRIVSFGCTRCGNCCRVPGYVHVADDEVTRIAAYLGMSVIEFTTGYTRLTADRSRLSLTEQEDGACVFLEAGQRCRIQANKPRQCRDFPLKWRFQGFEKVCPGVAVEHLSPDGPQCKNDEVLSKFHE